MIAEYLFIELVDSSWGLEEASCENIDDTGFEEDDIFLIVFSYGLVDLFIGVQ